jgi:hypothetical protein
VNNRNQRTKPCIDYAPPPPSPPLSPPPPAPPPSGPPLPPPPEGCTGCLPAGVADCYAACAAQSPDTPYGQCRYPGSVDPAQCCLCGKTMCPSDYPFVYRPNTGRKFDYCCATGASRSGPAAGRPVQNSLEELDARSHTCFGNNFTQCFTPEGGWGNPCIDYAPPPPPRPPPSAPPALPPGATLQREVRASPSPRHHLLRRPPPPTPHTPPHCR